MLCRIALALFSTAGLSCYGQEAQPSSGVHPLVDYLKFFGFTDARDALQHARAQEDNKNFLQAREELRSLIARLVAFKSYSFDVQVLLAAAEIDAARVTLALEPTLPPSLVLANRAEVVQHAHNAVIAAASPLLADPADSAYRCTALRIAGQAQFLEGLVEANRDTMLKGAGLYERVLACDPANHELTEETISFIRSHANETRNAEILKTAGEFAELAGWRGKVASLAVDAAYEFYKDHRESPFARESQ